MGRYKELREKQIAGTLTDDELKELQELEMDFKDVSEDEQSDEAEVEAAAEKLAKATQAKMDEKFSKMDALIEKLEKQNAVETPVEVKTEVKYVVDAELGRVPVEKLDETKIEIQSRVNAGKKATTITKKSLHFVEALVRNDRQKLEILTEGTAADGGILVVPEFASMIVEDRRDMVVMRQLATVIPVTSNSFTLPTLATRPKTYWRSEAAVKNTSTATWSSIVLTPYSLASIVTLSNELVADASIGGEIVNIVSRLIAQALAEEEDKAFWTGNGSGRPTGIDNYTFVTLTASNTDVSRADTLIHALYKLPQGYRGNAVCVANKNTWAKVATLKDANNQYLLTGLANSPSPTLRGRPVYEQNDIGDGKMFIGDFRDYYIADRQGITVDTSTEATVSGTSAFENNLTLVRVESRVDGELAMTTGVVEVQGLGTV